MSRILPKMTKENFHLVGGKISNEYWVCVRNIWTKIVLPMTCTLVRPPWLWLSWLDTFCYTFLQFLGQFDHETPGRQSSTTRRFLRPVGCKVCQTIRQKERQEIGIIHFQTPISIETAFGLLWLVVISFQTNDNKNKFCKARVSFFNCNFLLYFL